MSNTKGISFNQRIEILQKVARDFGQKSFCLKPNPGATLNNDANTDMRIEFDAATISKKND